MAQMRYGKKRRWAFPLEHKVPNATTRAAMAEAEEIVRSGKFRFRSTETMFAALDGDGDA